MSSGIGVMSDYATKENEPCLIFQRQQFIDLGLGMRALCGLKYRIVEAIVIMPHHFVCRGRGFEPRRHRHKQLLIIGLWPPK